jgi:hypothetical protein
MAPSNNCEAAKTATATPSIRSDGTPASSYRLARSGQLGDVHKARETVRQNTADPKQACATDTFGGSSHNTVKPPRSPCMTTAARAL